MKSKKHYYVKDYNDYTIEEEAAEIAVMKASGIIEEDAKEQEAFNYFIESVNEWQAQDLSDFMADLFECNKYVLASGIINTWRGKREGAKILGSIQEFKELVCSGDAITIYSENNKIFLQLADHDGGVLLELKSLTKYGQDYIENLPYNIDCLSYQQIIKMFNTNFYSKNLIMSY